MREGLRKRGQNPKAKSMTKLRSFGLSFGYISGLGAGTGKRIPALWGVLVIGHLGKGVHEQCHSIFRVILFCLNGVTHDRHGIARVAAACLASAWIRSFFRLYQWLRRGNREKDSRALGGVSNWPSGRIRHSARHAGLGQRRAESAFQHDRFKARLSARYEYRHHVGHVGFGSSAYVTASILHVRRRKYEYRHYVGHVRSAHSRLPIGQRQLADKTGA
jgi:hypothetical protein